MQSTATSRPLSEDDILELRAAFDAFDEGKTGRISVQSLKVLVRALGFQMTRGDVSRRVAEVVATTGKGGAASFRRRERKPEEEDGVSTKNGDRPKNQGTGVERQNVRQLKSGHDDQDVYDDDDDDFVDFETLCEVVADEYAKRDPRKEIEKAFQIFDTTKTGRITVSDVRKIACDVGESLTEDELRAMIDEFDKDGDGSISLSEFRGIMRKGLTSDC